MSRLILIAALLLAAAGGAYWWLFGRSRLPEGGLSLEELSKLKLPPPPETPKPTDAKPLPALHVTAKNATDARVELSLRGAGAEPGCVAEAHNLCPGEYEVRVTHGNQLALAVVRLERGESRTLELPLQPAVPLDVTLFDSDKLPVDRAAVTAQQGAVVLRGKSDSDGTVALGPVTPGDWIVSASREGWDTAVAVVTAGKSGKLVMGAVAYADGILVPAATNVRLELATPEHVALVDVVTDAGSFHLGPVPPGKYELSARSDDFEPYRESVTLPVKDLTVRLSSGGTLKGDLVSPTGERLDGTVTLSSAAGTRTTTARSGTFELRAVGAGRYELRSGFGRKRVDLDGGIARVELVVPRYDGVFAGTCGIDGGHRAPARYALRVTSDDGHATLATDCDAGRFELTGLPKGFYTLDIEAQEGDELHHAVIGPLSSGTRDLEVQVPGVAWLSYRLVGDGNKPPDGIGEHTREHYEAREIPLELSAKGRISQSRTVLLERGRDALVGDISLERGHRLAGRVFDAVTKEPVGGATVTVGGFSRTTQSDGTFVSSEAPEGDLVLTVSHPLYVTERRAATAPGDVALELQHAARVVGTLLTADGSTPQGLEVRALSEKEVVVAQVLGGTFATAHLADGHWLLRVVPSGGAPVSAFDTVELDIKGAGNRTVALVERAVGVTFEVQVTDREGAPTEAEVLLVPRSASAPLNAEDLEHQLRRPGLIADLTGKAGRYRFANVPPGGYTLLANAHRRVWTLALPIAVQQGMSPVAAKFEQVPYSP